MNEIPEQPRPTSRGLLSSLCLASLRKKATSRNRSIGLTPGALVEADRQLIGDLIAKASARQESRSTTAESFPSSTGINPLWFIGLLSIISIIVQFTSREYMILSLCTSALIAIIAFWAISEGKRRTRRIQAIADSILQSRPEFSAKRTSGDTGEQPVIENLLDQLKLCVLEQDESSRLLVDFNECGLITVDSEGTILEANLTFCDFIGLFPETTASKNILQFVALQDKPGFESKLKTRENFIQEANLASSALVCRFTFEWSQSLNLFYGSVTDITAQKNVQRLRQEFQSLISHDLRSPLTSLKLTIEQTLNQEHVSETSKAMLLVAKRSTQRLIDLVEQLLTLYSAEEGTLKMQMQITCASGIVDDAVADVQGLLDQNGITLKITAAEEKFVYVDHGRCVQILTNFLSNATKHAPIGSNVTVGYTRENDRVRFTVTDEGPGINKHVMQHLFDRFASVRDSSRPSSRGLGLPNCKILAEAQAGTVGVSSAFGAGTTFWLDVPAADEVDIDATLDIDE